MTEVGRLMEMMAGLQEQMSSMKRELSDEREAANKQLVKRIKLDKGPTFKKSNEKQYHFNEEVLEKLATASAAISTMPSSTSVDKAKEVLREGEDPIAARQKVIRIADRSEYGC